MTSCSITRRIPASPRCASGWRSPAGARVRRCAPRRADPIFAPCSTPRSGSCRRRYVAATTAAGYTTAAINPRPSPPPPRPSPPQCQRRMVAGVTRSPRRRRTARPDQAVTLPRGAGQQRRADHLGRVRPPQQHRHRQQHMRDQALAPAGPPRPPHPVDPVHPTRPCPSPRAQHTRATRAVDLAGRQPRLDPNRIRLYRHQRCLRASARPSATVVHDMRREGRCHVRRQDSSASIHRPNWVIILGSAVDLQSEIPIGGHAGSAGLLSGVSTSGLRSSPLRAGGQV